MRPNRPATAPHRLARVGSRQHHARVVSHLRACAAACTHCAETSSAADPVALARCIQLDRDCAALCERTGDWLVGPAGGDLAVARFLLDACALVCGRVAEECEGLATVDPQRARCAEVCRRCEHACREALSDRP